MAGGFVHRPHMAYSSASDAKGICVLLILSDGSHCDFIPGPPLPLALVSMRQVFVFPLTCQCDGARWVAAAHRVVMDTLRVRLGLIFDLTLFSRHHSPSLSIVDEFKVYVAVNFWFQLIL